MMNTKNTVSDLDVHALPEGLYFVSITDGIKHETLKLIHLELGPLREYCELVML